MSTPDLNLLITLDALLAEGSVAGAARRLGLSPSAMSRALARLRETTGDPLLVRAGRGLVPTPRAVELRDRVSQLVQEDRKTAGPADGEACQLEATPLAPGERFDARKLIPAETPAGTWRYETTLRLPNGNAEKVFTPPFTVTR